jgi:hypothetical protein
VVPVSSSLLNTTRDKSGTMAFLGQDPVRFKFFAVKKCLQKVENFKYLGYKFPMEMKRVFEKN